MIYNLQAPIICHPVKQKHCYYFFKLNLTTTAAVVFTVHLTAYFLQCMRKKDVVTYGMS